MRRIFILILALLANACTTVEIPGMVSHSFFPWEVRHISPEGSTSQCLGDFTDPICATDTLVACFVAGQNFLGCYGNQYPDDLKVIVPNGKTVEYVIVRNSYVHEKGNENYERIYLYYEEPNMEETTLEQSLEYFSGYRNMLCRVYLGLNCDYDITIGNNDDYDAKSDKRKHQVWLLVKYNDHNPTWKAYDFVYRPYSLNDINIWHISHINDFHKEEYWLEE